MSLNTCICMCIYIYTHIHTNIKHASINIHILSLSLYIYIHIYIYTSLNWLSSSIVIFMLAMSWPLNELSFIRGLGLGFRV